LSIFLLSLSMATNEGLLFDNSPVSLHDPFPDTPRDESSVDVAHFGGLVYDPLNKFAVMRNLIAPEGELFVPAIVRQHNYANYLQANQQVFVAASKSVGRVLFTIKNSTNLPEAHILSGWVGGTATRYFISSNHGLGNSSPVGLVGFSSQWDGEDPGGPHRNFFVVTLLAQSTDLDVAIWEFAPADAPRIPPPLSLLPR